MAIGDSIRKLRRSAKLTQEKFAEILEVSQQSVQKWESGSAVPEIDKLVKISEYFDLTLDSLVIGSDNREVQAKSNSDMAKPHYKNLIDIESYSSFAELEYRQSIDEGLDIEVYGELFKAISLLPKGETKKKLTDILFDIISEAGLREDYQYVEPSELDEIRALRKCNLPQGKVDRTGLLKKIEGAWRGRISGCMLGKSIECIHVENLHPFLKGTGNYPMHRYILRSELTEENIKKYNYGFAFTKYVDEIDAMPVDDDINYMVIAQEIIEKFGRDFTPYNVIETWVSRLNRDYCFTAERIAHANYIVGLVPPYTATHKNPHREMIGAQIRGDYFGYINPGDPETAAAMAWRDASVSHIKNGIYGEMFAAAMVASAAVTSDVKEIIYGGLGEIPHTSRLHEEITKVIDWYEAGKSREDFLNEFYKRYDDCDGYDWCHTISNATIVVLSLLYGEGDFGKSICMAVETGFDTDCNGATVGSILGMANGIDAIPEYWTKPFNDTAHTSIFGLETIKICDRIKMTMEHIKLK